MILLSIILLAFLVHRLALALDPLIFPRLDKVEVKNPLFIVGLPRSGTTAAHRMMASHSEIFTSMPLWELLFAPALCQKYVIWGAYKVDDALGGPLNKLINWAQDRLASGFDDIHQSRLTDPEEDYLGLLPFDGCFLRVLMFPYAKSTWALGDFSSLPNAKRTRLLAAYRALVQRHLAFRGEDLRLLSKNPSYTTWASDLADTFPDARFVGMHRDLEQVVPSQLSSIETGIQIFGHSAHDPWIIGQFTHLLRGYQKRLKEDAERLGNRFKLLDFQSLVKTPDVALREVYTQFQLPQRNPEDAASLKQLLTEAHRYKSKHKYALSDFGLQSADLL